jgi:hypothetical protein
MTELDYKLEKLYKKLASKPPRKDEETITSFNRDIFWYNRTETDRQTNKISTVKVTYEDHRKAIETAINIMKAETPHEIAMTILTHRFFAQYRADAFSGMGSFYTDYTFLLKKIGTVYNHSTSIINTSTIPAALKNITEPTLVQLNHAVGIMTKVKVPSNNFTLNEWAIKFNKNAPESTTYMVAGMKVGM